MSETTRVGGADIVPAGASEAWYTSLDHHIRDEIRGLAHDVRPMRNLTALLFLVLWAGAGAVVLSYPAWVIRVPGYVLMGACIHGLGVLMHEAAHGNFFRRRRLDRLAAFILGAPALVSGAAYRIAHLLHHRFNRTTNDPDEISNHVTGRRVLSWAFYGWPVLGMVAFLTHVPHAALRHGSRQDRRAVLLEYGLLLVLYAGVVLTVLQLGATAALLQVWLTPLLVTFAIVNLRGWSEHLLTAPGHPVTQSRTVTSNAVVRFFLCNLNYHLEHHLFPAVPWYHLPRVHLLLDHHLQRAGAFTYRSYTRFFWDALRAGIHGLAPATRAAFTGRPIPACPPGPSPYALLVYVPLVTAGVTWSSLTGDLHWWHAAGLALSGLGLWTLIEYGLHRYVFHIVPRSRRLLERQQHLQHHATPGEPDFQVAPLPLSLGVAAGLAALLRVVMGSWQSAILVVAGIVTGYLTYELLHFWIHLGGRGGRILGQLRRHHFYHHHADDRRCFGVTTIIWDRVFGTAPPHPSPRGPVQSPGRLARWGRYLRVMFPPALVAMGCAQFLAVYFALQGLAGLAPLHLGHAGIVGAISTVLWMLLIRLQDDVVDAAADVRLGVAGDPRYRDRPIVTGDITVDELVTLRTVTFGLLLGINLTLGFSPAAQTALLAGFGITWLGFHWFFIPALKASPGPLAYLARKSLTVLTGFYALGMLRDEFGTPVPGAWAALIIIIPALEVAAWEVGRKIRLPADETEYGTYSKVLGWRGATLLATTFLVLSLGSLVGLGITLHLRAAFFVAVSAAAVVALGACARLLLTPTPAHAVLQPFMELFGAGTHAALLAAVVLQLGGAWS